MKSDIFIQCEKENKRQDILICFSKDCRYLNKCANLKEVRDRIEEWYEKEKEKSGEDIKK